MAHEAVRQGTLGRLAAVPHRFFFLAGVVQLAIVSLWWAWTIGARTLPALPALPSAVPDTVLHALLMLTGFCPLFMFGFLFTAGPRWLGVDAPPPAVWLPPGLLAVTAVLAIVPLQLAGPGAAGAVRVAAAGYAAGWVWLALRFLLLLRASAATDKVHATLVLVALAAGAGAVAAFAVAGPSAFAWMKTVALWGFLLPAFVVVCHRMIPFFTASAIPFVSAFRPWWLLAAMFGAPVAHGVLDAAGLARWTWWVDLPAGALMLWLTVRWGLAQSLKNRLLTMLHIGFLWYGIGFALSGVDALMMQAGGSGIAPAPLHALTIGFASSLLMAMVTRVSCGHSGRTLAADALTWRLFQLLQLVAVLRVAAVVLPGNVGLAAAALLWAAVWVPWVARYAPLYWRARADGRPG
ncbi:MAG: NnrS family protein [Betaproteobacteria bacterium]